MFREQRVYGAAACVLLLMLISGSLLHGAVRHSHGHDHGSGESASWTSLHESLRHDDKKALFMLTELVFFSIIVVAAYFRGYAYAPILYALAPLPEADFRRGRALRGGILAHRAFR